MSLEIFQTLGAVVGFVAGAITLYDRLLRYKPFVSIYAEVEGVSAWPYLRLTNAAPYDIFVDGISIDATIDCTFAANNGAGHGRCDHKCQHYGNYQSGSERPFSHRRIAEQHGCR
jgi:hypothetical protein